MALPSAFQQLLAIGKQNNPDAATRGPDFSGAIGASLTSPGASIFSPQDYYNAQGGQPTVGSASLNAGGTKASTPPADLSGYDQSIGQYQNQLGQLSPALNNLLGQADSTYKTTINDLTQNKAQTDQVYNQNKTSNQQDYVGNKNAINTNTGNTISSLTRLLGSRGAGGQSAGGYAAMLAAQQGTQQRTAAGSTFGKNQQALDQNYGNYNQVYEKNLVNASLQKENDVNSAKATNATSRASILQSLAGLVNQRTAAAGGNGVGASQGYVNEANDLLAQATQLSAPRAVAAQSPLVYNAPTLDSYTATPTAVAAGGQDAASQSVTPYLAALQNRDKKLA